VTAGVAREGQGTRIEVIGLLAVTAEKRSIRRHASSLSAARHYRHRVCVVRESFFPSHDSANESGKRCEDMRLVHYAIIGPDVMRCRRIFSLFTARYWMAVERGISLWGSRELSLFPLSGV